MQKKKLNGRKITLRENESASLGTPDTRADSLLFFGREEGTSHSVKANFYVSVRLGYWRPRSFLGVPLRMFPEGTNI